MTSRLPKAVDLTPTFKNSSGTYVAIRPGISLKLYSAAPLAQAGAEAAAAIEAFMAAIPEGSLGAYADDAMADSKALTAARLKKDLAKLRNIPKKYTGHTVRYTQAPDVSVGDFSVLFHATVPDDDFPHATHLLSFELPYEHASGNVDALLQLFRQLAGLYSFQSGNAGFAFKRSEEDPDGEAEAVLPLLKRYQGFEMSAHEMAWGMRGHAARAHWLNFLGADLVKKLGGADKIRAAVPSCDIETIGKGLMIRAAKFPPVADALRKAAADVGAMPEVARLLQSLRPEELDLLEGELDEDFDIPTWLGMFDAMKSTAWDNGP
jgi:hypothetical protein